MVDRSGLAFCVRPHPRAPVPQPTVGGSTGSNLRGHLTPYCPRGLHQPRWPPTGTLLDGSANFRGLSHRVDALRLPWRRRFAEIQLWTGGELRISSVPNGLSVTSN